MGDDGKHIVTHLFVEVDIHPLIQAPLNEGNGVAEEYQQHRQFKQLETRIREAS